MKILFLDFDGVLNSFQSDTRSYRTTQRERMFRVRHWLFNHVVHNILDWLPDWIAQEEHVWNLR